MKAVSLSSTFQVNALISELRSASLPHSIFQFYFKRSSCKRYARENHSCSSFFFFFVPGSAFSGSFPYALNDPWRFHLGLGFHGVQEKIDWVHGKEIKLCLLNKQRTHLAQEHPWETNGWMMGEYRGKASSVIALSLYPYDFGQCQSRKLR